MKKITIVITLTLALALTSTIALAEDSGHQSFGVGPGFGFPEPASPTLTAEQSTQIQVLRDSFFKETEPLRKELLGKEGELRSLELTTEPNTAAIKARLDEISDLRAKLQEEVNNYRTDVQRILASTSRPHTVIPGEIFQIDPEVDRVQMYE